MKENTMKKTVLLLSGAFLAFGAWNSPAQSFEVQLHNKSDMTLTVKELAVQSPTTAAANFIIHDERLEPNKAIKQSWNWKSVQEQTGLSQDDDLNVSKLEMRYTDEKGENKTKTVHIPEDKLPIFEVGGWLRVTFGPTQEAGIININAVGMGTHGHVLTNNNFKLDTNK